MTFSRAVWAVIVTNGTPGCWHIGAALQGHLSLLNKGWVLFGARAWGPKLLWEIALRCSHSGPILEDWQWLWFQLGRDPSVAMAM